MDGGRESVLDAIADGEASRLWVSVLEDGSLGEVAQVVPSSGRTAGVYLAPAVGGGGGGAVKHRLAHEQRVGVIQAACRALAAGDYGEIVLAQGLIEPGETALERSYLDGGFLRLAELAYLRRDISRFARYDRPAWHTGVRVTRMSELPWDTGQSMLVHAMEASYNGTLDCPALCGMRTVEDVLASHKSVGTFDPALWWLVTLDGTPAGCMLLSRFPAHDTVELVYLGVGPTLRGKGVGAGLLSLALCELQALGERSLACAVDLNNAPALTLYKRAKFKEFARRLAMIRDLRVADAD
ncbi:MAG: GNAT family N-acetyltransferase [Phycisphaerales bacterium]